MRKINKLGGSSGGGVQVNIFKFERREEKIAQDINLFMTT